VQTKEFSSIADFCIHLAEVVVAVKVVEHHALENIGRLIERNAKAMIGHYQESVGPFPAWDELADSTKQDRSSKGYPENEPLLRDGTLRDSIEHEVQGGELVVGSKLDIAEYQEFGTKTIPPRPFIGPAAFSAKKHIEETLGLAVLHALEYGAAGRFVPLRKE